MSLLGKVQEFINPTPIEDKYQEEPLPYTMFLGEIL